MPIYKYKCEKCGNQAEVIQGIAEGIPFCCGKPMKRLLTFPALIRRKNRDGIPIQSKGYKEGYSEEYLKDIHPEKS